jgi:hypothetical protein
MLRITFANVIPRCKYSLIKVLTLASSLPVLLTASRRPCDGRGAEVWPYRAVTCLSCKRPRATKEAWALASSLCGLLRIRVALSGFSLGVCHSLLFFGTGIVAVPTGKDNYTKPDLLCQGDLALFPEQFRSIFCLHIRVSKLPGAPFSCAPAYYTKRVSLCQGDLADWVAPNNQGHAPAPQRGDFLHRPLRQPLIRFVI